MWYTQSSWYTCDIPHYLCLLAVTAVLLVYMSLLYQFKVGFRRCVVGDRIKAVHILEVIIGVELLISSFCLVYYIGELMCGVYRIQKGVSFKLL